LRAPISSQVELPVNAFAHIVLNAITEAGYQYLEISTTDERLLSDCYAMLMAVADRIQLDGMDPVSALLETLETWESVLATRARMSLESEIGLFGELLLLRALMSSGCAGPDSWRGGLREEHDFGLKFADLEVKTTTSEHRRHWIHGLNQLLPTRDAPLWILSIQITRGGGGVGEKLPELVDAVLEMTSGSGQERIKKNLSGAGWDPRQRDLLVDPWRLRTPPLALSVDDDFPRLIPAPLAQAGVKLAAIRQVDYQVDLSGWTPSLAPPSQLEGVLDHLNETIE
jgi:hypothetical protein